MNIFYLDKDPGKSARAMTDKHVVKMVLESAQLLCAAHRILDGKETESIGKSGRKRKSWVLGDQDKERDLYKVTHYNHPSSLWVRESRSNYLWLFSHFAALAAEYYIRYGKKVHSSWSKLAKYLIDPPKNIKNIGKTPIKMAVPEEYRFANPIDSYRNYYISEKLKTQKDKDRFYKVLNKK